MAIQLIDVGNIANDGTGDNLRLAFNKANANFIELYNLTGSLQAISVTAVGNTLVKRDVEGNIFANKSYYTNRFTSLAELPAATTHTGMLVYVVDEGFRASNGTEWVRGFGTGLSTQLNGLAIGAPEKIRKLNFSGTNIRVVADNVDTERVTVSVDADYYKTTVITAIAPTIIDTFSALSVKAAKYLVHVTTGSNVYFTEINVLNYGTDVDLTEYSTMGSLVAPSGDPVKPGEFSASINNGQVELVFTPLAPSNTVRLNRYSILD